LASEYKVKNCFEHIGQSAQFEMLRNLKRNRFYITWALAIVIPLLFYVVPALLSSGYPDTANQFSFTSAMFVSLLVILSAAIFGGDAISAEFEKKTGLYLFPTPQRRSSIFIGRYISNWLAIVSVLSIFYLVTGVGIIEIYGTEGITTEFIQSYLLSLLYGSAALSVVFMFSASLKRTISSTMLGIVALLLLMPIVAGILTTVSVDPWFILTNAAGQISDVFGVSPPDRGPVEMVTASGDLATGVLVMASYTVVLFVISILIANRRALE